MTFLLYFTFQYNFSNCDVFIVQLLTFFFFFLCSLTLQVDAMMINEIKDDLKEECSKYGEVKKVMIFDVSIVSTRPPFQNNPIHTNFILCLLHFYIKTCQDGRPVFKDFARHYRNGVGKLNMRSYQWTNPPLQLSLQG